MTEYLNEYLLRYEFRQDSEWRTVTHTLPHGEGFPETEWSDEEMETFAKALSSNPDRFRSVRYYRVPEFPDGGTTWYETATDRLLLKRLRTARAEMHAHDPEYHPDGFESWADEYDLAYAETEIRDLTLCIAVSGLTL